MQNFDKPIWWTKRIEKLLRLSSQHENVLVYFKDAIIDKAMNLRSQSALSNILYAMKANFNPEILKLIAKKEIGFECVSTGEISHLMATVPKLNKSKILFTPNFAPKSDYIFALDKGITVTVDNIYPLMKWPEIFYQKDIFLRIDLNIGDGHHSFVNTGGDLSKFGIPVDELSDLMKVITENKINIIGLHTHSGSGILDPESWYKAAKKLINIAIRFPNIRIINLGGGIPIRDKTNDECFDLNLLNSHLLKLKKKYPKYDFWLEPGRYLVGESGVILTKVTQLKKKGTRSYIGVEVGMNTLIRPALYGAFHEIINLSRCLEPKTQLVSIVGPICESGDKLGDNRKFPISFEGDTILIANTGAYVRSMASNYNLRDIPEELMI